MAPEVYVSGENELKAEVHNPGVVNGWREVSGENELKVGAARAVVGEYDFQYQARMS